MAHVATYIDVQPASTTDATVLLRRYRESSSSENGNSWIELMQETSRMNRFVIVEAWKDESSLDAHERAGHVDQFRANLKTVQNSPYDRRVHQPFAVDPQPPVAAPAGVYVVTHVDVP